MYERGRIELKFTPRRFLSVKKNDKEQKFNLNFHLIVIQLTL